MGMGDMRTLKLSVTVHDKAFPEHSLCSKPMRKSGSIKFSVGTLIELQNRYRNSTDSLEPLRKIKNLHNGGRPKPTHNLPPLSWFYFSIE